MGKKDAPRPRIVCCAIPIARAANKILIISSRKRQDNWVVPKGGYEQTDRTLEAAAEREALEEAGCQGKVTKFVTTIYTETTTYHFFEMDVTKLDDQWLESGERTREWVDYTEASKRLAWKPELQKGLSLCSLAPKSR